MKYYIQGDPQKADQIKAAFEKLGITTVGYHFSRTDVLFFTFEAKDETYLMSAVLGTGLDNIILTHQDYQELELPVQPKFKVGQAVVFDGSVLTIHRIIEGYYLFNNEGSRGCRIDQQDKFVELKFNVGDYLKNKEHGNTATVVSIDVKEMCYRVHGYLPIPIIEQDQWENLDDPRFKVGDLVVFNDLIGRVNEVTWQDHFGFAYKVGNIIDIHECDLQPADHRDVTRIVKNG